MAPMLLPKTAASTVASMAAAIDCAPVMVSHETRFSLPSRCSTTTRIVFAIDIFAPSLPNEKSRRSQGGRAISDYADFVPQLVHQLFRHFRRRAFQHLGLLG